MDSLDLNTWHGFWQTFHLPIAMSLIGAVIGHYRKNGVIQLPIVSISYQRGPHLADLQGIFRPIRWIYLILDFITYVVGLRWDRERPRDGIWIDLGFLGDMLVGVGTGILAKTGLSVTNTVNTFTVVSASLLAGFFGLSYIQAFQNVGLKLGVNERLKQLERASEGMPDLENSPVKELYGGIPQSAAGKESGIE